MKNLTLVRPVVLPWNLDKSLLLRARRFLGMSVFLKRSNEKGLFEWVSTIRFHLSGIVTVQPNDYWQGFYQGEKRATLSTSHSFRSMTEVRMKYIEVRRSTTEVSVKYQWSTAKCDWSMTEVQIKYNRVCSSKHSSYDFSVSLQGCSL